MRRAMRRWGVACVATASMVLPAVLGLGFPQLGGYGSFAFLEGCEECIACIEGGPDPTPLDLDLGDPPEEPPETDPGKGKEDPGDDPTGETRRQQGGKIPDAVTRPRVDPNLRTSPGYKKGAGPKAKY